MSGSRRNRILNLNASTALPNHQIHGHSTQPSHQQVGPALAHVPYQQPPVPTNNAIAASVPPRPMVIQYAVPHHPPNHTVPAQTRPQYQYPSQIPTPTRALPPPSPTQPRTTPATDLTMDRLSQSIVTAIKPTLAEYEKSVAAAIKKVEGSIEKFATDVKEARTETDRRLFQLTDAMHKSLQIQQAHTKVANKRIEKIEALIMASFDRNDEMSLISRLENIQYAVGELSERVKDPGAPQDLFIAAHPAQTTNDIEARAFPTPPESIEERAPSPVQCIYGDKSTSCDIPEPSPERAPSPVRPLYKDAASDAVNLEPELPVTASLIRPEYKNVGSGPRTPSPPRRSKRTLSSSSFEPPSGSESDHPRSSISSFRRKSSEVTTEFEQGSRNDVQALMDAGVANSSLRLKRKRMNSFTNSEEESIVMAHSEDDNLMVIDVNPSADVEPDVESEPELNKMSTDEEVHDDAQLEDEHESDSPAPATTEYSPVVTSRSPTPVEGSVAALRQTVFGSSREASLFAPSQEQHTLPSPATTPSAPASPKREPSPLPAADPAPATTPSRQLTPKRPVFTVSSPTSSSNPEREASLPKPDHAEPASIPVPTPPTPVSAPLPKVNVTPNSDAESEMSVSRMVTAQPSDSPEIPRLSSPVSPVPEHVEQPQTQASFDATPLFFPGSRSQSPPSLQVDDAPLESPRHFLESPPPSPKTTHLSLPKSQSARPTTPVVQSTPTKAPATIFNTPYNKLRRGNSDRSIISIKSTPQKTPTITRQVIVRTTRPPISSRHKSAPEAIVVHSSPIFVPSRSASPLSVISSASEPESEPDSDSASARVIRKKKEPKKSSSSSSKVQAQVKTEPSASTSGSVVPSADAGTGSITVTRRIDLLQKLRAKKGESAALTRVRKRKAPTAEQMEPPLKRARQKASASASLSVSAAEVEREMRVKRERMSVGLPSGSVNGNISGRGKGKGREREREDDKGYRLPSVKVKASPTKEEKKLRPRAPPAGVKWPQKNTSGDKKFDQQFIECEKCYMWYHYGCIGITDLNDPVAKGDKPFICPPCTGGGANPMLPSDNIVCARPDCEREEKKADEYFMTAIIGRHTKVSSGTGRKYMWLVKWDGYSIKECTWEEEDGMSDPHSFIQDFNRKATREGKDPDEDPYSTILLREAISGGWTDPNA